MKNIDYEKYIGSKVKNLKIVNVVRAKNQKPKLECLCDCGEKCLVGAIGVIRGEIVSCGCYGRNRLGRENFIDITGQKFGKLTVIGIDNTRDCNGKSKWKCVCECGKETFVYGYNLKNGNTTSCGCQWYYSLNGTYQNPEIDIYKPLLNLISAGRGKQKGMDITIIDIKEQWERQKGICPYTGIKLVPPGWYSTDEVLTRASIDRIDSSKGYVKGNIQFVSMMMNFAKNKYDDSHVINLCKAIAAHWKDKI
jgi:hypothetical protein